MGSMNWFDEPYEYNDLESAKAALVRKKETDDYMAKKEQYEIVFKL